MRAEPAPAGGAAAYRLFGLAVRSDLALPELAGDAGAAEPDVEILLGDIDAGPAAPGLTPISGGALLTIPRVARYAMIGGRRILVEPEPGAGPRDVRLFLIGSAFGALLHQRGILPLHANAVAMGGGAVAFCGPSGSGKSTLAAWFHDRGRQVLADDVCAVTFGDPRGALVQPGVPRLRLWRDAVEASGREPSAYERAAEALDKYNVPTDADAPAAPAPLRHVCVLRPVEAGGEPFFRTLSGGEAVRALVSNTYRGEFLGTVGSAGRHLASCIELLRHASVHEVGMVRGRDRLEEQVRALSARLGGL